MFKITEFLPLLVLFFFIIQPLEAFAFVKRHTARPQVDDPRDLPPMYQTINRRGIVQPAQSRLEFHQTCEIAGIDSAAGQYYNSLSHLHCAQALRAVRHTHYGANLKMGKYYKCDNHQVPELAFWLATDEELAAHQEPDGASCPDNWYLKELHVNTLDGDCFIGWDCWGKAGGQ